MSICIEIVVLNDDRIFKALESLREQTVKPDRILIADGGSSDAFLSKIKENYCDLPLDILNLTGKPVESRYKSLKFLHEDITVFLDSDQYAPSTWLESLVNPLENGDKELAYSGGPTKPYRPPSTSIELYLTMIEDHIYDKEVSKNLTYVPLGNTAWKTAILKNLGFDKRLKFEAEDNDLETRAYKAGYKGILVVSAWVWHDKTMGQSFIRTFRKRYIYLVGATTVFLKNGTLLRRSSERKGIIRHQFAILELLLKPIALLHALCRWHIIIKHQDL